MLLQIHTINIRMAWLQAEDMGRRLLRAEVDQEEDIRNKASKEVEDNLVDPDVDSLMVRDEESMGNTMGKVEAMGHLRRKIRTAQTTALPEHMDGPDQTDKTQAILDSFPLSLKDNTLMTPRDR